MTKTSFLRRALIADAFISGPSAVLMLAAAAPLSHVLGVPDGLLQSAGISLIPFCALLVYLCTRDALPRAAVWLVIGLNAGWVVASVLLLVSDRFDPSRIGTAFIIVQAIAVAVFAEMQYVGLRRATATA